MKKKSAAILTIHKWADMTNSGREDILCWLQRQIEFLGEYAPEEFSPRFTARFLYPDEEEG